MACASVVLRKAPALASTGRVRLVEEPVETSDQSGTFRGSPDPEERSGDVRLRSVAGVVTNREPFSFRGEDDFGRDDEAGKAD